MDIVKDTYKMRLFVNGLYYTIENEYIPVSPFLSILMDTDLGKELVLDPEYVMNTTIQYFYDKYGNDKMERFFSEILIDERKKYGLSPENTALVVDYRYDSNFVPNQEQAERLYNEFYTKLPNFPDIEKNFVIEGNYTNEAVESYLSYLRGESFTISSASAYELFQFMGHVNDMNYPLEFWAIKLRDNWIRDNFYRLDLWKDPYFGLVKIPLKRTLTLRDTNNNIVEIPKGSYIAGGAALYMSGHSEILKDLDVFFTNTDAYQKWVDIVVPSKINLPYQNYTDNIKITDKFVSVHRGLYDHIDDENMMYIRIAFNSLTGQEMVSPASLQFIFRKYSSPAEIIYGFDLDCVGILYDGKDLWCTERAKYAIDNKVNWFDPMRASPSYIYRLGKYTTRGYRLELPLIKENNLNMKRIEEFLNDVSTIYHQVNTAYYLFSVKEFKDIGKDVIMTKQDYDNFVTQYNLRVPKHNLNGNYLISFKNSNYDILIDLIQFLFEKYENNFDPKANYVNLGTEYPYSKMISYQLRSNNKEMNLLLHGMDDPSRLILIKFFNIFTSKWRKLDYDPNWVLNNKPYDEKYKELKSYVPNWKKQDPMTQVTSTFHPEPIDNLLEWYQQSPFIL